MGYPSVCSYLTEHIYDNIEKGQMNEVDLTIADDDMIELKQIKYQNFSKGILNIIFHNPSFTLIIEILSVSSQEVLKASSLNSV